MDVFVALFLASIPFGTVSVPGAWAFLSPTKLSFLLLAAFVVVTAGRKVWNWSHGRFFIAAILNETIKPGETRTFRAQWDLKGNDGKKLAAGKYRISAWLTTGGKDQPAAPPVDLVVK